MAIKLMKSKWPLQHKDGKGPGYCKSFHLLSHSRNATDTPNSDPTTPSPAPPIYAWIIIGIVVVIVIVVFLVMVVAVVIITWQRKKGRVQLNHQQGGGGGGVGGGGGGHRPHPVKYKPTPSQANLLAEGGATPIPDKAYDAQNPAEYEEILDDAYVEIIGPDRDVYENVDDKGESIASHVSASPAGGKGRGRERGGGRGGRGQGDAKEMRRGGGGGGAGQREKARGVGSPPTAAENTSPKSRNPAPSKKGPNYVNNFDAFTKEIEMANLSGANDTPSAGTDMPPYVNDFNEFTKEIQKVDLSGANATAAAGSAATTNTNVPYVNDFDEFAKELEKAEQTSAAGKKAGPHSYENDFEDFSKKLKTAMDGGDATASPTRKKSNPNYVNDLGEFLNQEDIPSDEDEEGYTIFDPDRTQPDGAEVSEEKGSGQKEGDIYENNPVRATDRRRRNAPKVKTQQKEGPATAQRGQPEQQRPYVNDLDTIAREAKILLEKSESPKRHHPYVNDVAMIVNATVLKKEGEKADEDGSSATGAEGSERRDPKHPHYVNNLSKLLQTS